MSSYCRSSNRTRLYRKLNRKVAWDHPDNKVLLDKVPDIFALQAGDPAASATATRFQALVGTGGVFDPSLEVKFTDVTDGSGNTLLLVEAGDPVHWAAPRDLAYKPGGPVPKLGNPAADTFLILLADGSTRALPRGGLRPVDLTAIFTRSGNEVVDWAKLQEVRKLK